ncbi:MAG: hypothetical protein K0R84_46 [Clostridia bacterium]|jgi:hypothetical protein|nr:hypothetical protein [Clostridia bacterium]
MNTYDKVEKSLMQICEDCDYIHTDNCSSRKCNIAFAKEVVNYAEASSALIMQDGERLIPKQDVKYYKEELIADGIANICKLCKECRENHSEECVISLSRRSLENTILKENVEYPGNILMYIMEVSKQNEEFAQMISAAYSAK